MQVVKGGSGRVLGQLLMNRWLLVGVCLLLFLAFFLLRFPGEPNSDSNSQYHQIVTGQFNDWHPPLMARIWEALTLFGAGTGPIFAFDTIFYGCGVALLASLPARRGRWLCAYCMIFLAAQPMLLMMSVNIAKDIMMAVMLLLAVAIIGAVQEGLVAARPARTLCWALALLIVVMAALVRSNAVFLVAPMLVFAGRPALMARPVLMLALSAVGGVLLVPASNIINHRILGASDAGAIRSLQIFDIAGIMVRGGDDILADLPGAQALTQDVHRCYSPIMWDTLAYAHWNCHVLKNVEQAIRDGGGASLSSRWTGAIRHHPLAYLRHRLTHYNSTLYFWVPVHHTEAVRKLNTAGNRGGSFKNRLLDHIRYSPLTSPVMMVAIALVLLPWIIAALRVSRDALLRVCAILIWLALIYTGTFLLVGVATDQRYFFFTTLAVCLALPLALSDATIRAMMRRHSALAVATVGVPAAILALTVVARYMLPPPV